MNLSAFHVADGYVVQIVVIVFTLALFRELAVVLSFWVYALSAPLGYGLSRILRVRFLFTFLAQAFRLARETVRRWWQAAIVAVFRLSLLQRFDVLGQAPDLFLHLLHQNMLLFQRCFQLLDSFITLRQVFTQRPALFSQMLTFFFELHTLTLLDFSTLDKSLLT